MKKNIIIVTGGAGFIGSNLISLLIEKTQYKIICIDNYSSGSLINHIKNKKVRYIKGDTNNINILLNKFKNNIHSLFHFGEFSRIYQSFLKMNDCFNSNIIGTNEVFNFCFINKIKLIYSATSASIGNKGKDMNLSPYAFTKAKNLEMLENLKKWFKFKFEVIYFYNVYGPKQIDSGNMATVIGIFEKQFKKKINLTVVKPGNQTRRFTHVADTVEACYYAWEKKKCRNYSISSKKSYSILEVAKMFNFKLKFLPPRKGERYSSALTNMNSSNKIHKLFGKINLRDYVANIVKNSQKKL